MHRGFVTEAPLRPQRTGLTPRPDAIARIRSRTGPVQVARRKTIAGLQYSSQQGNRSRVTLRRDVLVLEARRY